MLFPEGCAACEKELVSGELLICTDCRVNLPKSESLEEINNSLRMRFRGRVNFEYAISFFKYTKSGKVQNLLHEFKYNGVQEIGAVISGWVADQLIVNGYHNKFDLIIPVPLHKSRLRNRGFNQAEVFAKGISEELHINMYPLIAERMVATKTQTGYNVSSRWENVKDIFIITDGEKILGKRVLIVDDIVTTGATIESLANEIRKYKPLSISLLTMADADH